MEHDEEQMYTDCSRCQWFGIPIIDDGAPEVCDRCIVAQIEAAALIVDKDKRAERMYEIANDLAYFYIRQDCLPDKDKRSNLLDLKEVLPEEKKPVMNVYKFDVTVSQVLQDTHSITVRAESLKEAEAAVGDALGENPFLFGEAENVEDTSAEAVAVTEFKYPSFHEDFEVVKDEHGWFKLEDWWDGKDDE